MTELQSKRNWSITERILDHYRSKEMTDGQGGRLEARDVAALAEGVGCALDNLGEVDLFLIKICGKLLILVLLLMMIF